MVRNLIILLLSFGASFGFGVTFHIRTKKNLFLAGIGGLITRAVSLLVTSFISQRFLTVLLSAVAASLYGELMARKKHVPAVYFIYPSIIPLIPGDLFHYAIDGLIAGNYQMAFTNAIDCFYALLGLGTGMMISTTTIQSIRKGPLSDDDE